MKTFTLTLKIGSLAFFVVGLLHLFLGLGAEVILGANLPDEVIQDPVLDSQNRFYGVSFTLYGVLLLVCASDVARYITVLRCILWVFFAAGAARLVSIALYGMPPASIVGLLVMELAIPPVLFFWLSKLNLQG